MEEKNPEIVEIDSEGGNEPDQHEKRVCYFSFDNEEECTCVQAFRNEASSNFLVLPSEAEEAEIFFPKDISENDPRIYGKWIIDTRRCIHFQDHLWVQLQTLIQNKDLILLGSSKRVTGDSFETMIMCYTSKDLNIIKDSGIKIFNLQKDLSNLKYKANEDNEINSPTFILSPDKKLLKRQATCSYAEIPDSELQKNSYEEQSSENSVDVELPAAKRKKLESDDQFENACQFEYGANMCKCVEEFIKNECEKMVDFVLPSIVTDKEEIYFPEHLNNYHPSIYGKWLIFTNGNIKLQDHLWIQLRNLIKNGDLILLLSSTAKPSEKHGTFQGVIMCYTPKDIKIIRQAGLAIQSVLRDDTILDYKTNEASQNQQYRRNGVRFITKFMLTVNGKLYKRDKLNRWIQITDAEYENYVFDQNSLENCSACGSVFVERTQSTSDSNLLPSLETRKKMKNYVYPSATRIKDLNGVWCLNCSIIDPDDDGLTELDRAWKEAKALQEENYFRSVTCQTKAFKPNSKPILPRRSIMLEVDELVDVKQIITCADKIREKVLYNMPMFYKIMRYKNEKPYLILKYLYTQDGELYEYIETKWKLLKAE